MTEFSRIQTKVCEDTIERMKQARKRKCEADFYLEKSKLLDALEILKTVDHSTHAKYSKYSGMTFHTDDGRGI